jgi:hypothetical protein
MLTTAVLRDALGRLEERPRGLFPKAQGQLGEAVYKLNRDQQTPTENKG